MLRLIVRYTYGCGRARNCAADSVHCRVTCGWPPCLRIRDAVGEVLVPNSVGLHSLHLLLKRLTVGSAYPGVPVGFELPVRLDI